MDFDIWTADGDLIVLVYIAMLNIFISYRPISPSDSDSPGKRNCYLLTPADVRTVHAQLHNQCVSDYLSTQIARV